MSSFSSLHHSFDITLAAEYGIEEAILIHHFQHWIKYNRSLKRNFHDERTWTYQTREEITAHFPYWNEDRVRRLTDILVKKSILIKGNFNKTPFDRTVWYAFKDESKFLDSTNVYDWQNCQMEMAKEPNGIGESATPIPHTIQDTKTEKRERGVQAPPASPPPVRVPFGSHVKLSEEEKKDLDDKFGKKIVEDIIEDINDYIQGKGLKPYKDYAAVIRTWLKKRSKDPVAIANSRQTQDPPDLENRPWMRSVCRTYYENLKRISFFEGSDYVEFPKENSLSVKVYFRDSKFKEIVTNELRKFGILL